MLLIKLFSSSKFFVSIVISIIAILSLPSLELTPIMFTFVEEITLTISERRPILSFANISIEFPLDDAM